MSLLSPTAAYHAQLREQLGLVGRALALQRAVTWLVRGLALGLIVDLGIVGWAWTREAVASIPILMLAATPVGAAVVAALAACLSGHSTADLARRIDRAAGLQERSVTALELGSRGSDHPLAVAQMRDAVEHLKRLEPLETFPPRAPRRELLVAAFVAATAALLAFSPNPWLLSARAANPRVTAAREQAQKVERVADSLQAQDAPELNQLRGLLAQGARTIEARSNEPEEALAALEDLEQKVRDMSAGDDQLSASLAAMASALAGDSATQQLAAAINTGDLRQISQAAKDLAQRTTQMNSQERQRVATVLREAASRAGRSSSVATDLAKAADALQSSAAGQQAASSASDTQSGSQQDGQQGAQMSGDQAAAAAQQALNNLSQSAAAASERQRVQSQLETSRNALERALGRTESRSGSNSSSNARSNANANANASSGQDSRSDAASQRDQGQAGQSGSDAGQGGGQGQRDTSDQGQQGGASGSSGDNGDTGDGQPGGGYSTGGQNLNNSGPATSLDSVNRPERVPSDGSVPPDYSSDDPSLSQAGNGASQVADEAVQPSYARTSTQGSDNPAIPLGLRDLVKDYFSSLDQK